MGQLMVSQEATASTGNAAAAGGRITIQPVVLRATFAISSLLLAVTIAATRYVEVSFAVGGDPWMVGDWLINYGGGFVRRGLFGQIFLALAPAGVAGLWFLFAIQIAIYITVLAYCLQALHRSRYSWSTIALVCGPAGLAFIGWVPSIDAAFRKELLSFLVLALLAWARHPRRSRSGAIALVLVALPLYLLAVFSWEASALLLPAVWYLLLSGGASHPELDVVRRSAAAVFAVIAGVGAIVSTLLHGDVATANAVCDTVREYGFSGPYVCSGGTDASGGAIEALGWTSYKTTQDLAIAVPVYAGYIPLILLSFIPVLLSRWFRSNWKWAALIVLGVLPLYFIVTDYGRWTHIIALALMFCITADDPADAYSPWWNGVGTILYTSLWGMPHWMGWAQFGVTFWHYVGLLPKSLEMVLARLTLMSDQATPATDTSTLSYTARYLTGLPFDGHDSWFPMTVAMNHVRAGGADLYQALFFEGGVHFRYSPTSLLLIEPFYVYVPTDIAWPLNALSWLAVLVTGYLAFRIANLLVARATPSGLPGAGVTLTLMIAGLALTLTYYPLLKAWDLGHLQSFVILLCSVSLYSYIRGRRGLSGVALGFGSLLAPQLCMFALWGVLRRDWRFVGGLTLTAGIGLIVSVARNGLLNHLGYIKVLSFLGERGEIVDANQSVNGLLNRALAAGDALSFEIGGFPPFNPVVFAGSMLAILVFVGLALGVGFRPLPSSPHADPLDFSIAMVCFTIAWPIVWEHNYGVLLPLYAVTLVFAWQLRRGLAMPVIAGLILSYLLTANLWGYVVTRGSPPGEELSTAFLGALLLLGCMVVVRVADANRGPSSIAPQEETTPQDAVPTQAGSRGAAPRHRT